MKRYCAARCVLLICILSYCGPVGATDYTTFNFDNARDGWNNQERLLTVATAPGIRQYANYALDAEVDAQPLYLHSEYIPSMRSMHSVAYVATENNTIYAIDPLHGILWQHHYGTPVGMSFTGRCMATAPTIGIQGTPVIDRATDTMYFVSYALMGGRPAYVLHAIAPGTGADKMSVNISAKVGNASVHRPRAGLLESSGNIYIAFSGFCDHNPESTFGRVLSYTASTLQFKDSFVTTSSPLCGDFHLGTIWAMGFAPAADAHGNVYFTTGNGCIDYTRLSGGGYADAVLRLTARLRLVSTSTALFAPCTAMGDNRHDQEMGSAGVLLAPGTRFAITGGKTGLTYVLDKDNLGGYTGRCPDRIAYEAQTNWGLWGGPVAWNSSNGHYIAIPGTGPYGVREYALNGSTGALSLRSQTGERLRNGGESAIVTSSGTDPRTAVLWLLTRPTTGTMYLQAYNALNLRQQLLSVAAGSWGNSGGYAAVSPTVADGLVLVATNKQFTVWTCCMERAESKYRSTAALAGLAALSVALGAILLLRRRRAG